MPVPRSLPILALVAAAACSSAQRPAATEANAPTAKDDVTWSDPTEYHVDRATESAGETIFEHTGIGDPYRTGLAYPIFLGLLRMYPDKLGETPAAMAAKFGFVDREPDATFEEVGPGSVLGKLVVQIKKKRLKA